MLIIPAVDLKNGKCVRLVHGEAKNETVYSDNPLEMAEKWAMVGAKRLHVIDLDGAFTGVPINLKTVLAIKKKTNVMVQVGGGIRTIDTMKTILHEGVDKIILGTIVFQNESLAQEAFDQFRDKIIVALDVKNEEVAVKGWKASSGLNIKDALKIIEQLGGKEIIYTDVGRDGTLEGVNLEGIKKVMDMTPSQVYASGGVSNLKDIQKLKEINSPGCIVGKALYDEKLNLLEALQVAGE